MNFEEGDVVITGPELTAAPAFLDLPIGPLSRIPRIPCTEQDQASVADFFSDVSRDLAISYRNAIATLANPSQVGVLHYSLGEESISRAILAYGPEIPGQLVLMISCEGKWRISAEPVSSLVETVSSVLLKHIPLFPVDIRCTLSQDAGLVFLALLHLLRESRLLSILSHKESTQLFEVTQIEDVLNDASTEDFRWPFFFLDKVFPFSSSSESWNGRVPPALEELQSRELVAISDKTYHLTPSGYRVLVAMHQHLTKVGIRITRINEKGIKGHEAMLFVRSLQDLFLFDFGGKESTVASLDFEDTEKLISEFLHNPDSSNSEDRKPSEIEGDSHSKSCPACASRIPANAEHCPTCGVTILSSDSQSKQEVMDEEISNAEPPRQIFKPEPIRSEKAKPTSSKGQKYCIQCGAKIRPGDKFCISCGAKLKNS